MFFMAESFIPFNSLSSKSKGSKVFTYSNLKMALSFAIIDSIIAARTKENKNLIFECEKINQFALSLEYNSKIAVIEFIFHCSINSRENLRRKFTQI